MQLTSWPELETVIFALLVLGRKMSQLWITLGQREPQGSFENILELPGGRGVHGVKWGRT